MPLEPNFGLAHRQVLGRRPDVVKWTPSKPLSWWIGGWREGHRFTVEQERALIAHGRDPVTANAMTVRREAPAEEVWTPNNHWRPVYEFEVPVLGTRADGKVIAIAPNGSRKFLRADGWATKPSRFPVREW